MRRLFVCSFFVLVFLAVQSNAKAQEILVPAGSLLHCTLDEPNFSSATADVGDPVICHLNGIQEFGRIAFPRGSYLQGHLEASREPGHFVGKGYLRLEFDRIGLPNTDVPVPSKVVGLRGYHVDREGDIVGKGHAKRDAAEWLFPPLWPWKVLALPARGPRPALKGESQLTLRLMDDIVVPKAAMLEPGWHYFSNSSSFVQPSSSNAQPSSYENGTPAAEPAGPPEVPSSGASGSARTTLIALKSGQTYTVARYQVNSKQLSYRLGDGATGMVQTADVDWVKTSHLNADGAGRSDSVIMSQSR